MMRPIPNVSAAAAAPRASWRPPLMSTPRPVSSDSAAPTANRARPLSAALATTNGALAFALNRNGMTGTSAPPANPRNNPLAPPPRRDRQDRPRRGPPGRAERRRVQPQLLAHERVQRHLRVLHQPRRRRLRLLLRKALRLVDERQLALFLLRGCLKLAPLQLDLALEQLALGAHGDILASAHGEGAGEEARDAGQEHELPLRLRAREPHDERHVGDEAIADAEDAGAQGAAAARAVPRLPRGDRLRRRQFRSLQASESAPVLPLVGRDRPGGLVLRHVGAVGARLHPAHDRQDGANAEAAGEEAHEPHAEAGAAPPGPAPPPPAL